MLCIVSEFCYLNFLYFILQIASLFIITPESAPISQTNSLLIFLCKYIWLLLIIYFFDGANIILFFGIHKFILG